MDGAVHPRVLAYLGRALSLELSAVQQYMFQATLADSWGDGTAADRFRHETVEELQHAERIVRRMLELGVAPSASQLRPVTHAPDLQGLLRQNHVLEKDLTDLYAEAMRFCVLIRDGGSESFFHDLWKEETHHGEELATWLQELGAEREPQRAAL